MHIILYRWRRRFYCFCIWNRKTQELDIETSIDRIMSGEDWDEKWRKNEANSIEYDVNVSYVVLWGGATLYRAITLIWTRFIIYHIFVIAFRYIGREATTVLLLLCQLMLLLRLWLFCIVAAGHIGFLVGARSIHWNHRFASNFLYLKRR